MAYKMQSKLLVVILFCTTTISLNAQKKMTTTQKEVLKTVETMTTAFQKNDINGVMACYEPTAVVVFEPESPVSDPAVLRAMFTQMAMLKPQFTYDGHEVLISGNTATHIAPWKMTATAPDGTIIKQSGLSIAVLRKQKGGNWLMVIDNPHGQFLLEK